MLRNRGLLLAILTLTNPLGCALCSTPFDLDYVTFGSRTPRVDIRHGRVGSTLSDPEIAGDIRQDSSRASAAIGIQPMESEYGSVLESTPPTVFVDEFAAQSATDVEEPMLLEQRPATNFKPKARSHIIQVPSGDSFFDDEN